MTRYLVRSSFVHFAAASFLLLLLARQGPRKNYYTIDFIAGTPASAPAAASAAPAAAKPAAAPPSPVKPAREELPSLKRWLPKARAATLKEAEVAERARKKNAPKLSEAPPAMSPSRAQTSSAPPTTPPAGAPGAAGIGGGQGGASVGADVSDFPYPWYLQRLRTALWNQWSQRMPGGGSSCVVTFTIARDGSVSDISVTTSGGADAIDYAATSAVEAAAPFPPLPAGFGQPTLRAHVTFQSL